MTWQMQNTFQDSSTLAAIEVGRWGKEVGEELLILTFMPLSRERKGEKGGGGSAGGAVSKVKDEKRNPFFFWEKKEWIEQGDCALACCWLTKKSAFSSPGGGAKKIYFCTLRNRKKWKREIPIFLGFFAICGNPFESLNGVSEKKRHAGKKQPTTFLPLHEIRLLVPLKSQLVFPKKAREPPPISQFTHPTPQPPISTYWVAQSSHAMPPCSTALLPPSSILPFPCFFFVMGGGSEYSKGWGLGWVFFWMGDAMAPPFTKPGQIPECVPPLGHFPKEEMTVSPP